MTEKWRRCPSCRKAGPESAMRAYKWYGSRRWGRRLPSGFRCPACGHRGDGYAFRYAEKEVKPQEGRGEGNAV